MIQCFVFAVLILLRDWGPSHLPLLAETRHNSGTTSLYYTCLHPVFGLVTWRRENVGRRELGMGY